MTTTVKIHVNGRYRATVTQHNAGAKHPLPGVIVEGAYEGSPNPTGYGYFSLPHPAAATFTVVEEYVPQETDEPVKEPLRSGASVPEY